MALLWQMVVALSNMTRTRDAFAIRCAGINEAMIQQALPQTMQTRVRRFYEYIWLYERGRSDAMKYVREVPAGLRSDIMCSQYALFLTKVPLSAGCNVTVKLHAVPYRDMPLFLTKVPLFAGCKSDVIARLAERLVPHLFLLDELIVREGYAAASRSRDVTEVTLRNGSSATAECCRVLITQLLGCGTALPPR
jgi:hypothetical protein